VSRWAPLSIALAATIGCRAERPAAQLPPAKPQPPPVTAALLSDLALFATGALAPAAEVEAAAAEIQAGQATLDGYVDRLLDDPRFARDVAPRLILGDMIAPAGSFAALSAHWILKTDPSAPSPVYFLRKPCPAAEAERVHPWWDPKSEVAVCPDAHRPEVLADPKTGFFCGTMNLVPFMSPVCGCGPGLINCYRDRAHHAAVVEATFGEVLGTIEQLIRARRPVAEVFTVNETFRDAAAEANYVRWDRLAGKAPVQPDPAAWAPHLAPRPERFPGQHAGILTTPHLIWLGDAPRGRLNLYSRLLFCTPFSSIDVAPEKVLALGAANVRNGEGWESLAATEFCTNCHARLDYGAQFFLGWPNANVALTYVDAQRKTGRGKLYLRDIEDLRGEAELTPRAFVELAMKQPEFAGCRAESALDYVLGARSTPEDRAALSRAYRPDSTLQSVMKGALLRYAALGPEPPPPVVSAAPAPSAAPTPAGEVIAIGGPLRSMVEEHCVHCHDPSEPRDLSQERLPRSLVAKMLSQVAFGRMPQEGTLEPDQRQSLVNLLIERLWSDPAARTEARSYFAAHLRSLPTHHFRAILKGVQTKAGGAPPPKGPAAVTAEDIITQDRAQYTPGLAATMAAEALASCKATSMSEPELDRCMDAAATIRGVIKERLGAGQGHSSEP
jgi:hypothetical protein